MTATTVLLLVGTLFTGAVAAQSGAQGSGSDVPPDGRIYELLPEECQRIVDRIEEVEERLEELPNPIEGQYGFEGKRADLRKALDTLEDLLEDCIFEGGFETPENVPEACGSIYERIQTLEQRKENAVERGDFEDAAKISRKLADVYNELDDCRDYMEGTYTLGGRLVPDEIPFPDPDGLSPIPGEDDEDPPVFGEDPERPRPGLVGPHPHPDSGDGNDEASSTEDDDPCTKLQKAIEELRDKRREAYEAGDDERFNELDDKIREMLDRLHECTSEHPDHGEDSAPVPPAPSLVLPAPLRGAVLNDGDAEKIEPSPTSENDTATSEEDRPEDRCEEIEGKLEELQDAYGRAKAAGDGTRMAELANRIAHLSAEHADCAEIQAYDGPVEPAPDGTEAAEGNSTSEDSDTDEQAHSCEEAKQYIEMLWAELEEAREAGDTERVHELYRRISSLVGQHADCADDAEKLADRLTCEQLEAARDMLRRQYQEAQEAGDEDHAAELSAKLQDVYEALDDCQETSDSDTTDGSR